jgi:hypothetical protein
MQNGLLQGRLLRCFVLRYRKAQRCHSREGLLHHAVLQRRSLLLRRLLHDGQKASLASVRFEGGRGFLSPRKFERVATVN